MGADRYQRVDVRVIAATHRNLRSDVNTRRFRSDLYYRLAVLMVTLPPLRDRVEDVPLLVEHLLEQLEVAPEAAARLRAPAFLAELSAHRWPGNVRELRNYLERAAVADGAPGVERAGATASYKQARARWERAYAEELLRAADGNVAAAARQAGLDRAAFYRLLWRHGLK